MCRRKQGEIQNMKKINIILNVDPDGKARARFTDIASLVTRNTESLQEMKAAMDRLTKSINEDIKTWDKAAKSLENLNKIMTDLVGSGGAVSSVLDDFTGKLKDINNQIKNMT